VHVKTLQWLKNELILIFSDRQAAFKALNVPKVTSELVAEFLNALSLLADLNEVTLFGSRGTVAFLAISRLTTLLAC
jgi:hypothetical protein